MTTCRNKCIMLLSITPVRREPQEQSEMVTQLLFGEIFYILEETKEWCRISIEHDGYQGWVNRLLVTPIENEDVAPVGQNIVSSLHARVFVENTPCPIHILRGSILPSFLSEKKNFKINGKRYRYEGDYQANKADLSQIISFAKEMQGTPYLWGGRTLFGIDCSGFTQLIARMGGLELPRDAYQQASKGVSIDSFKDALEGDFAFFANDYDKITHVGILLQNSLIIHASGQVRIDSISKKGIFNKKTMNYTHRLHSIRRLL